MQLGDIGGDPPGFVAGEQIGSRATAESARSSLLHYVIWKTGDREGFGITKLYKVLWFSDARAFMLYKEPITGETYIREKYGPMPKHAAGVLNEMQTQGVIRIWIDKYFNQSIRRFKSLQNPDRLTLSDTQRQMPRTRNAARSNSTATRAGVAHRLDEAGELSGEQIDAILNR